MSCFTTARAFYLGETIALARERARRCLVPRQSSARAPMRAFFASRMNAHA
jgi:hypothetical protein